MEQKAGWVRRSIPSAEPEGSAEAAAPERSGTTFIDLGASFDGTLRLAQSLRIDSEFRGAIHSEGTVIVGEAAGIEADIHAREVVICGAVVGNVHATRQLTIRAGGRLHGDVETPCLEIERHAFFNGQTRMMRPEAALRAGAVRGAAAPAPAAEPAPAPAAPAPRVG